MQSLLNITISVTTDGAAQRVEARGFGLRYDIVTMNNRIFAIDNAACDLGFDVPPLGNISCDNQRVCGPTHYPFDGTAGTGTPISVAPDSSSPYSIIDEKKRDALTSSLKRRPGNKFKLQGRTVRMLIRAQVVSGTVATPTDAVLSSARHADSDAATRKLV